MQAHPVLSDLNLLLLWNCFLGAWIVSTLPTIASSKKADFVAAWKNFAASGSHSVLMCALVVMSCASALKGLMHKAVSKSNLCLYSLLTDGICSSDSEDRDLEYGSLFSFHQTNTVQECLHEQCHVSVSSSWELPMWSSNHPLDDQGEPLSFFVLQLEQESVPCYLCCL